VPLAERHDLDRARLAAERAAQRQPVVDREGRFDDAHAWSVLDERARSGQVALETRSLEGGELLAGVAPAAREHLPDLGRHLRRPAGPAVHRRFAEGGKILGHGAAADDLDARKLAAVDLVAADMIVVAVGIDQVAHRLRSEPPQGRDRGCGGRRGEVGIHDDDIVVAEDEQDVGVEEEPGRFRADEGVHTRGPGFRL
jgi:hypothetical protein